MAKKQKFYVVWKGRQTGVFTTWEACRTQVLGFENAQYQSFDTRREAEAAFARPYADRPRRPAAAPSPTHPHPNPPIADSYTVDAACEGNPGWMEYRCVHTTRKTLVFKQGPFADGTNNIGEFLAIVHALAWLKQEANPAPVYSDSQVAIGWVKARRCKTKNPRTPNNEPLFALIARAEAWLAENPSFNPLLKWNTQAWGEIPADYGRK